MFFGVPNFLIPDIKNKLPDIFLGKFLKLYGRIAYENPPKVLKTLKFPVNSLILGNFV